MRKLLFIIPVVSLVLLSCSDRRTLSPEQYIAWAKASQKELIKTKEINGYRFTLKFQPAELLILKNAEGLTSEDALDSMKKIQKGIVNLVMDIGSTDNQQSLLRANLAVEEEYYQRMYYYTTDVQKDLYLVEGKDTLPCVFYHFEQTFNITPVNSMIMEFERKDPNAPYKDIYFIYEDRILNAGIIKFQYKKSFLNNLPKLKIL